MATSTCGRRSTEFPRGSRGVAATHLPWTISVAAAASPRPVGGISARRKYQRRTERREGRQHVGEMLDEALHEADAEQRDERGLRERARQEVGRQEVERPATPECEVFWCVVWRERPTETKRKTENKRE